MDITDISSTTSTRCRSQWPRRLRRRSSAARLLRLWVRIPPRAWMFACCECCVLSGRGLWDGLITRPEESYRLWGVVVCDQETSKTRRLKPAIGLWEYNHSGLWRQENKQTNMCTLHSLHIYTTFLPKRLGCISCHLQEELTSSAAIICGALCQREQLCKRGCFWVTNT